MRRRSFIVGIFLLLGIGFILSCEEDDICLESGTARMHVQFQELATMERLSLDTLVVQRLNAQNEFEEILDLTDRDSVLLPLRLDSPQTTFVFALKKTNPIYDTLVLTYQTRTVFISKACGSKLEYDELQAQMTDNVAYSFNLEQNAITNETNPHLIIFY